VAVTDITIRKARAKKTLTSWGLGAAYTY